MNACEQNLNYFHQFIDIDSKQIWVGIQETTVNNIMTVTICMATDRDIFLSAKTSKWNWQTSTREAEKKLILESNRDAGLANIQSYSVCTFETTKKQISVVTENSKSCKPPDEV